MKRNDCHPAPAADAPKDPPHACPPVPAEGDPKDLPKPWYTYFLRCEDGSLYVGITTDPQRRFAEHAGKKAGARYTKLKKPVRMEALYPSTSRAEASRLEYRFKRLSHEEKEAAVLAAPIRDVSFLVQNAPERDTSDERSEA